MVASLGLSLPIVIGIVSIMEHFKDLFIQMLATDEDELEVNVIEGSLSVEELESIRMSENNPLGLDSGLTVKKN